MQRTRSRLVAAFAIFAVLGLTAACAPSAPGGGPAPINWSFKGTSITVVDSQDEVRDPLFGLCIAIPNCNDEPYLIQVAFRVTIGQPGSAQAWVTTGSSLNNIPEGPTVIPLTGGQQAKVNFNNVKPLDVLDALNPNNKMDIVGTYVWAAEEDTINSLSGGANSIASIFQSVLNATLAAGSLPDGDVGALLDMLFDALFDNIGTPFNLILSNIPCLGLCDDVLGGAVYVGLGATGSLAQIIDGALGSFTVPNINIPLVDVPPDVQGGGLFTMRNTKDFTQNFHGAGGHHRYTFQSGPA